MNAQRIVFAAAALTAATAAAVAFWPLRAPQTPEFDVNADAPQPDGPRFQSLAMHFDRANLPEPTRPTAPETAVARPPDPAEALQRYRYIGMADSDGRKAAVFESGGATQILKPGDDLAGFTLSEFDETSALFELEGRNVRLPLAKD